MTDSHWYSFGRDRSDAPEHPISTAIASSAAPTPVAATITSQDGASAEEDDEPPPLIKGRTWPKKKKAQQMLKKQYYKRYELDWPKLRKWLEDRFRDDDVEFKEELDASRDYFVFYTPKELTDSRVKILELDKDGLIPPQNQGTLRVLVNDIDLLNWLGVPAPRVAGNVLSLPSNLGSVPTTAVVTNPTWPSSSQVRCRIIFFQAPTSEAKLTVTRNMASRILTYFQVMPNYIDFLSVFAVDFGEQVEAVELRFSGFRERVLLSTEARGVQLPCAGLTGQNFQLCYNLKCVALKYGSGKREDWLWSPRQAVFHHQFDVGEGTTLWIIASARDELQYRFSDLTGSEGRSEDRAFKTPAESFISSLSVHLLLAQWATEDWRGYIRWLEQVLEEKTIYALRSSDFIPGADDISFIQKKEDETNKGIMMLNANADILEMLERFYARLMRNPNFPLKDNESCKIAIEEFFTQIQDFRQEFKMHASRAKTLGQITADRKNLVQQHLQAHTTKQMKALTEQAQRETINMRVIAIVTFFLLPATFVSTFFSTDVVKYQGGGSNNDLNTTTSNESFSPLALQRWFEVTAPLTLITFGFAGCLLFWPRVKRMGTWLMRVLTVGVCFCRGNKVPREKRGRV
ncbi:hypothetical protein VTL71DRAFT_8812 [Oculimacula yallundae]|uniref:CorA-like transporter domain-containing protein n=1 Tax=Oculimacula yallundae TaxID=86028 RepID=A0ABR4CZN2_9HELO